MTAREHYEAGRLTEAVAAMNEEVKQHPADASRRGFLCELLCFTGDLERADRLLETMQQQTPETAVGISLFRQTIRAELARREFHTSGRVPEVVGEPTPGLRRMLEASLNLREGQPAAALKLLEQVEAERPPVRGTCDGQPFEGLRDLDDLLASVVEVLTSTGKFFLVPLEQIDVIEFHPPERPRDLLWRRAHMVVAGGPDGEVFIPTLYPATHTSGDDRVRLGRATEWVETPGAPVRGVGQRMFLIGDQDRTILELKEITIEQPS
jgi:type VI secretion system protein ImpE